jgi:hypothetical protein
MPIKIYLLGSVMLGRLVNQRLRGTTRIDESLYRFDGVVSQLATRGTQDTRVDTLFRTLCESPQCYEIYARLSRLRQRPRGFSQQFRKPAKPFS